MAVSSRNKYGLDVKIEGNEYFVKRRFAEALACYSAGIAAITHDSNSDDKDKDLEATLLSNRSGCYYEMGDYANSAIDAKNCVQILMEPMGMKIDSAQDGGESGKDIKLPPLIWKNLYRLARALHFDNAVYAEVLHPLNLITTQNEHGDIQDQKGSGEFASMASKMKEHLKYYLRMPSNKKEFEPSLLRASFQNPFVEYYNFGHDVSESLLQRNEGSNAKSILLEELDDEELSSLSFLFGGVGDGRHAFATLLDSYHQYQSLSETKRDKFRLHMTLNDISAQLLAKDALVLVLAYELGAVAESVKSALTTANPFNVGMVIYYVTLGFAMPAFVHQKMVACIKRWFTDSSRGIFQETFPWLVLSEDTWECIITIMNAWVDPEAHYSPELPSTKEILRSYNPARDDLPDDIMRGLSTMGAGSDMLGNMKAKLDFVKEQKRKQIVESFQSMDLTADMISNAKEALGDDATEKEMRNFLVDIVLDQMLSGGSDTFVSSMDKLFIEQTKCLYPQYGPSDEIKEELTFFALGENGSSKKETITAIKKYKSHIWKNWVSNPVQIDSSYHSYTNGVRSPDEMNPIKEFPAGFLTEKVISFMSEPPLQHSRGQTDQEKRNVVQANTLAFNLIRYYWHVGRAVGGMSGKTTIEISLGSIIALGDTSIVRESRGLPTKYHCITLSNIPDYTGMLSVFITLAPLLPLKSKSINPCFQSNTLLNTGLWKSYDDYIFSTSALSYKDAEAVFRFRVADQEPSVWGQSTVWEQADDDNETHDGSLPLPHDELRTWLHRLFLLTILPADRDANSMLREEKASNVNLFLRTLSHCVNHLDMPAHFIISVLEDLLKKKTLVTKATLSNDSPAPYLDIKDAPKKRYALSAFQTELANQTAIFLQYNMLGFRLLDTSFLPAQKASLYELKVGGIDTKYSQYWAYKYGSVASAMSLGFMIQKTGGKDFDISTAASDGNSNPMLRMMAMMQGGGMPDSGLKSSKLRRDLLSSGDQIGHIFSCMHWNLANQTASFWMCDDVFEKFSDHHFRLIRTDGWFCLPHEDVQLGDAKRIV